MQSARLVAAVAELGSLGHMSTPAQFHLRAFGWAEVHFAVCAFLGAFVWMYFLADGWFNQTFEPLPWWLSALYWLVVGLEAPIAAFVALTHDIPYPLVLRNAPGRGETRWSRTE